MKKIFAVLFSLMLVASLSACGDSDAQTEAGEVIAVPTYEVELQLSCSENLLLNKYNLAVYIDSLNIGTLEHGSTDMFEIVIEEGNHTLTVEKENDSSVNGSIDISVANDMSLSYNLTCSSDQIEIAASSGNTSESDTQDTQAEATVPMNLDDEISLTVDTCDEMASMLSNKAEIDPSYSSFASKYAGRVIEFDGRIDYVVNHGSYDTRYDILVSAGDYNPDSQIGPVFKLENVSAYDLDLDTLYLEDEIWVGRNIHIVAKVKSFDTASGLFYLDPISVTGR